MSVGAAQLALSVRRHCIGLKVMDKYLILNTYPTIKKMASSNAGKLCNASSSGDEIF